MFLKSSYEIQIKKEKMQQEKEQTSSSSLSAGEVLQEDNTKRKASHSSRAARRIRRALSRICSRCPSSQASINTHEISTPQPPTVGGSSFQGSGLRRPVMNKPCYDTYSTISFRPDLSPLHRLHSRRPFIKETGRASSGEYTCLCPLPALRCPENMFSIENCESPLNRNTPDTLEVQTLDIAYGALDSKYNLRSPTKGAEENTQLSETEPIVQNTEAETSDSSLRRTNAESGGEVDAVVELEAAVAAVSCSVTLQTHPLIQTCSSGPSWTTGVSGSLPRSHSSPSLSHMTSAEKETLTRARSLPDVHLNSSCEQFTPDVTADEDHETYRFQCSSPGLYRCSVTGLVFHMEREGDVVYRTVPWNRRLLSQHHKQPAGPLFDIKCEQQSVCQLHLPHCEIRSTGGADFLSVAHLDEEDVEFIGPHKITETHVIINITGLSAFGNVKDEDSPPDPVRALVLVFYRPPADPDSTLLLNVMLLPRNVAFRDVLRYRKKLDGDERYIETSPHCKLQPQQEYTLCTCPQDHSVLVDPTTAEFDSDNYDNYFPSFQVTLERSMTHLKLFLRDTSSSHSVWERRVCLSWSGVQRSCGQSALNLPPNQRLFDIRSSFIEGASGPVLKSLLDKLLEKTVMTDSERESADEMRNRGDKARFVIDTVRRKGEAASSEMIQALCELDPFFSEHLGLS